MDATPNAEPEWPARLYRLADDVDTGMPGGAVADALRAMAADMCTERRRTRTVADIAGGTRD